MVNVGILPSSVSLSLKGFYYPVIDSATFTDTTVTILLNGINLLSILQLRNDKGYLVTSVCDCGPSDHKSMLRELH